MRGLFGLTRRDGSAGVDFERAAGRVSIGVTRAAARYLGADGTWAASLSSPGVLEPDPGGQPSAGPIALVRGDISNQAALWQELGLPSRTPADLVLALLRQFGPEFPDRIEGEFALAILDPAARRVLLATDPFGTYPLYWHAGAQGITFGSELGSVLAAMSERPGLDVAAVADYVTMGFVLGERTLAGGVSLLDPGTSLVFDVTAGTASRVRYFDQASLFQHETGDRATWEAALRSSFEQSVSRSLTGPHRFGLSLSGGLDSRAILSAVNGHPRPLITYTLGVRGCADEVIADQLSRLTSTDHRFFELNDSYLRDFLPNQAQMVSITDGLYLSHGLTEMLALRFLADTGIDVLLRGHGGELAKTSLAWPLHTDAHVYQLTRTDEFVDYLAGRANYISARVPVGDIFMPAVAAQAGRGAVDAMHTLLADVPLTPAQLCSYLYLREHHRRFTIPSLELFRTVVDVRLPFVDRTFLSALLSAPPQWRDDTSVHRSLTRAGNPRLLKVRNSNTGAPGDAGPLVEKVLDKFNTLLKRLNAPGYRHYHHFDKWMRTTLLETVERELVGGDARTAIFLRPGLIRRLIDETRTGTADHGYLLQVLLTVELWQRENGIDRVAS